MVTIKIDKEPLNAILKAVNDQMDQLDIQADECRKNGESTDEIRAEISELWEARKIILGQESGLFNQG